MLIGSQMTIIYTILGALYFVHSHGVHMLALVVLAIGCYAMSLAPVTWVVIAEIFPEPSAGSGDVCRRHRAVGRVFSC